MRTLKKTLSLLLAVALVLSLTVVGASAAYTGNKVDTLKDAADVGADYSEAVGVMVGLGIIEGYDDGTLRPETTYTREQAAKIIAYMQLGPKDADSLRCTKAPFTDVAADRWSAGYIAYCVEQGIIDGMGDGTFQPEAQLTGYQWAKMLLCAVGYGRNDEYVGSSWSLNTAKDALDKGIFDGDLDGADHTPLQRQQAILYAFNALTGVKVVVYSPSLGDYITRYGEFADRATMQGTLGENVYKLDVDTGIIVDNEAMGNTATVLSKDDYAAEKGDLHVAANTGLDMMYHAAKIWYVNDKTAVYVMDLATVETTTCNSINVKDTDDMDLFIGDKSDKLYEYNVIDNSAVVVDGVKKVDVKVYARLDTLGTRSEVKKTTVIGNEAVANDAIKTDISKINKRDQIVVIEATSKEDNKSQGWHVTAVGATSGSVKSVNSKGVVTLSDDTVIAPSALATMNAAQVRELIEALASPAHSAPVFSFVLDTHGDYIALTNNPYRTVAYYTGAVKLSSAHDAWSSDVTWLAQFVDVATGEVEEIPVRNSWAIANGIMGAIAGQGKYFDITDELYGDETYAPEEVPVEKLYGTSYVVTRADINSNTTFPNKDNRVDVTFTDPAYDNVTYKGGILYNNDNVTFYIASFQGNDLVVDEYTGVSELVAAYAEKHNTPVSSVTLENIAMVVTRSDAGNYYATTIFAYDGALNVSGGTIFFPTGSDGAGWTVYDNYFTYDYAYIDGVQAGTIKVPVPTRNYERGFYSYVIDDRTGFYTLTKINTEYVEFGDSAMEGDGTGYYLEGHPFAAEYKIVDTRADADVEVDSISELKDLVSHNYNDAWEHQVRVAYHLNAAGEVDLVYVVDNKFGSAEVTLAPDTTLSDWVIEAPLYIDHTFQDIENCIIYKDDLDVTLGYNGNLALTDNGTVNVWYTVNGVAATEPAKGTISVDADDDITVNVPFDASVVPDNASVNKVKITEIDAQFTIGMTDALEEAGYTLTTNKTTEALDLGTPIKLGIANENVVAGIEATVSYTINGVEKTEVVKSDAQGRFIFTADPSTLLADTVVEFTGIEAKYTVTLSSGPSANWSFTSGLNDANNDVLTFTGVPGVEKRITIYRHDVDGANNEVALMNTTTSGSVYSNETAVNGSTNQAFTFDVIFGANENRISGFSWVAESEASNPAVEG